MDQSLRSGRRSFSTGWAELRIAFLGGVLAGLVLFEALPSQPALADSALRPALALRVIDGDRFVYGEDRIRIADIDTPETHPSRCAYEAELGARATERLRQLLARPFELQPVERDVDRYGRKLRI